VKVRVSYTVEVTDAWRRAYRASIGHKGLATREEVQGWFEQFGTRDEAIENYLAKGDELGPRGCAACGDQGCGACGY